MGIGDLLLGHTRPSFDRLGVLYLPQTYNGALALDPVPYGRTGRFAINIWVKFGNLFGSGVLGIAADSSRGLSAELAIRSSRSFLTATHRKMQAMKEHLR